MKAHACGAALLWASVVVPAWAQPAEGGDQQLAKQLSNPVADLVSVPLQLNWDNGVGPDDSVRFLANFQPVVPFGISEDWNLIGRLIVPYLNQPALIPDGDSTSGVGDLLMSGFFSPAKGGGPIWGVGPVISLPTTTDPFLGSGKWSAGPTGVLLIQSGPWTYGALANHLWSFADASDRDRDDVDASYLQPFLAYATKTGFTTTLSSESSANWEADHGERWTVPLILSFSKITRFGPFPFSIGAGAGYYVDKPTGGPEWKLRMSFTIILPKAKK